MADLDSIMSDQYSKTSTQDRRSQTKRCACFVDVAMRGPYTVLTTLNLGPEMESLVSCAHQAYSSYACYHGATSVLTP